MNIQRFTDWMFPRAIRDALRDVPRDEHQSAKRIDVLRAAVPMTWMSIFAGASLLILWSFKSSWDLFDFLFLPLPVYWLVCGLLLRPRVAAALRKLQ